MAEALAQPSAGKWDYRTYETYGCGVTGREEFPFAFLKKR